ncbi:MAG: glutathionylspermidine synthase family protein, partial [Rhodospirillales bacterium]|nr:glutathionylspermidine synthase family protein [Rhodospirillales bacterium]
MDRLPVVERAHWPDLAAAYGLALSNGAGRPLWRESAYWHFSAEEVAERLTAPAAALERMGYAAVEYALGSDTLLRRLGVPEYLWDTLTNSWRSRHKHLAGRFDLAYDGHGPPRLLGYEADAPAGLAEAALFQASWLNGRGFGQFNAIAEALGVALKEFGI